MKTTLTFNHKFKKGDKVWMKISNTKRAKCSTCNTWLISSEKEEQVVEVKIINLLFSYSVKSSVLYNIKVFRKDIWCAQEYYLYKTKLEAEKADIVHTWMGM